MAHPDDGMTDALKASVRAFGESVSYETLAPYHVCQPPCIRKIGFADLKVFEVIVDAAPGSLSSLIPAIRQLVFQDLAAHGMPVEAVRVSPSVSTGGNCFFLDTNPASATCGAKKKGQHLSIHFEIEPAYARYFEFSGSSGKYREPQE